LAPFAPLAPLAPFRVRAKAPRTMDTDQFQRAVDLGREMILVSLMVSLPLLVIGLGGLLIAGALRRERESTDL